MNGPLQDDPLLKDVPEYYGFNVLGPCVLYETLGSGGLGAVYRGYHLKLEIEVAVKCLKPILNNTSKSNAVLERFKREARVGADITHQNLVSVKDIDEMHGLHYIVMEYVRGETSFQRVRRKGPLEVNEALLIVLHAANGLAEAHRLDTTHRDIKPENIMITAEGRVKVLDLGLAKAAQTMSMEDELFQTIPGLVMGTPPYMPPEQWKDITSVGPPGDVWSLGGSLYMLLAGTPPYRSKQGAFSIMKEVTCNEFPDITKRRDDIPPEVKQVLDRCMRKEPEDRFAHAGELAEALAPLCTGAEDRLADSSARNGENGSGVRLPTSRIIKSIKTTVITDRKESDAGEGAKESSRQILTIVEDRLAPEEATNDPKHDRKRRVLTLAAIALVIFIGGTLAAWQMVSSDDRGMGPGDGTAERESVAAAGMNGNAWETEETDAKRKQVLPLLTGARRSIEAREYYKAFRKVTAALDELGTANGLDDLNQEAHQLLAAVQPALSEVLGESLRILESDEIRLRPDGGLLMLTDGNGPLPVRFDTSAPEDIFDEIRVNEAGTVCRPDENGIYECEIAIGESDTITFAFLCRYDVTAVKEYKAIVLAPMEFNEVVAFTEEDVPPDGPVPAYNGRIGIRGTVKEKFLKALKCFQYRNGRGKHWEEVEYDSAEGLFALTALVDEEERELELEVVLEDGRRSAMIIDVEYTAFAVPRVTMPDDPVIWTRNSTVDIRFDYAPRGETGRLIIDGHETAVVTGAIDTVRAGQELLYQEGSAARDSLSIGLREGEKRALEIVASNKGGAANGVVRVIKDTKVPIITNIRPDYRQFFMAFLKSSEKMRVSASVEDAGELDKVTVNGTAAKYDEKRNEWYAYVPVEEKKGAGYSLVYSIEAWDKAENRDEKRQSLSVKDCLQKIKADQVAPEGSLNVLVMPFINSTGHEKKESRDLRPWSDPGGDGDIEVEMDIFSNLARNETAECLAENLDGLAVCDFDRLDSFIVELYGQKAFRGKLGSAQMRSIANVLGADYFICGKLKNPDMKGLKNNKFKPRRYKERYNGSDKDLYKSALEIELLLYRVDDGRSMIEERLFNSLERSDGDMERELILRTIEGDKSLSRSGLGEGRIIRKMKSLLASVY